MSKPFRRKPPPFCSHKFVSQSPLVVKSPTVKVLICCALNCCVCSTCYMSLVICTCYVSCSFLSFNHLHTFGKLFIGFPRGYAVYTLNSQKVCLHAHLNWTTLDWLDWCAQFMQPDFLSGVARLWGNAYKISASGVYKCSVSRSAKYKRNVEHVNMFTFSSKST